MLMTLAQLNTEIVKYVLPSKLADISWSNLGNEAKTVALNRANKQINRLMFIGHKVDEDQEDQWPRIILGETVELPDDIIAAICDYVYEYLHIFNTSTFESIRQGITSEKIGPVSVTYDKSVLDINNSKYQEFLVDWVYRGVGDE